MRVRFLREAGGLGDVVRCLGTVGAVKHALPECKTWFYTMPGYASIARICPDVNHVVEVPFDERRGRSELPSPRKHRYLAQHPGPWYATVDMYCPAFVHERETHGAVTMDRIDCWTGAAAHVIGVDLQPTLARFTLDAGDTGWVDGWLYAVGLRGRRERKPLVGMQPLSVDSRRSLSAAQVRRTAEALLACGCRVLYIHGRHNAIKPHEMQVNEWVHRTRTPIFVAPSLPKLAAMVSKCDAVLCSDSGVLHVAAALDVPAVGAFGITSGAIICKHYQNTIALDAGPRERAFLPCARSGRACYAMSREARQACESWCPALGRVRVEDMVSAVMGVLR